jgi:hypothetical protein
MFLSNPAKPFLAGLILIISAAGCGLFNSDDANRAAIAPEGPRSNFPFQTKEPENYRCDIIETAGDMVRKKRITKKGLWRRIDLDVGEASGRTLLQTDKEYIIDPARRVYAETGVPAGGQFSELTHELLSTPAHAEFEETGRDGQVVSYTVRPADSPAGEIVVHYDASIGMPVRQEFFSGTGENMALVYSIELQNFSTEADDAAFAIPPGFRKVPIAEMLNTGKA